jgi:hypothetical protein
VRHHAELHDTQLSRGQRRTQSRGA